MERPETWFIDLDGCVLKHHGTLLECLRAAPEALPGSVEFLAELQATGHRIVLVTGRPWTAKSRTEWQLQQVGAIYHQLVMDVTGGVRYLVNDRSASGFDRAVGVNVPKNQGLATR